MSVWRCNHHPLYHCLTYTKISLSAFYGIPIFHTFYFEQSLCIYLQALVEKVKERYSPSGVLELHTRQKCMDFVLGSGLSVCSNLFVTILHVCHPYLVSPSFCTIPLYLKFKIQRIFIYMWWIIINLFSCRSVLNSLKECRCNSKGVGQCFLDKVCMQWQVCKMTWFFYK